jgi:hypothetical protein
MSRAARLTLSATAWIALGAAAFFLVTTEQKVADRRSALRSFDVHAREAAVALADARAAQQAYVAAGQSSTRHGSADRSVRNCCQSSSDVASIRAANGVSTTRW